MSELATPEYMDTVTLGTTVEQVFTDLYTRGDTLAKDLEARIIAGGAGIISCSAYSEPRVLTIRTSVFKEPSILNFVASLRSTNLLYDRISNTLSIKLDSL